MNTKRLGWHRNGKIDDVQGPARTFPIGQDGIADNVDRDRVVEKTALMHDESLILRE